MNNTPKPSRNLSANLNGVKTLRLKRPKKTLSKPPAKRRVMSKVLRRQRMLSKTSKLIKPIKRSQPTLINQMIGITGNKPAVGE